METPEPKQITVTTTHDSTSFNGWARKHVDREWLKFLGEDGTDYYFRLDRVVRVMEKERR